MAFYELSEGGLAAVSETLLGALEETGDTKLLVPLARAKSWRRPPDWTRRARR